MRRLVSFETLEGALSGDAGTSRFAKDNSGDEEYQRMRSTMAYVVEKELTPLQQECIRLYYYDGLTMEEAAQLLGVRKSSVCKVLHRAKRRIERVLRCCYGERLA